MNQIMFVCHGNICRSPMAEFVFRDLINQRGLGDSFLIASSATSKEELGNPVHIGTRNQLKEYGISTDGKQAVQLVKDDYLKYDYIVAMDQRNVSNINRMIGQDSMKKIYRLLEFTESPRDIADPWYTGDFKQTYEDVYEGCEALLDFILRQNPSNSK